LKEIKKEVVIDNSNIFG